MGCSMLYVWCFNHLSCFATHIAGQLESLAKALSLSENFTELLNIARVFAVIVDPF